MVVIDGIEPVEPLFVGSDDISALCRTIDWSATALGDVAGWPSALRTAVRICLDASAVPMAIWAGHDLTLIYNQGYAEVLGLPIHSGALGRPAREVWSESWSQLGPQLRRVMEDGKCVQSEGALLQYSRSAGDERTSVPYSLVPVRDERGDVLAALNVVHAAQEREEHLGKTLVADVRPQAEPALYALPRTGERFDFEVHGTRSAQPGIEQDWSDHWAPIKDPTGRIIGIGVAAVEITDRKRAANGLAESEERFRTLADNIPQLAWIADSAGSIFWYNRRWYEYTGTTFEAVCGWGWQKVLHPDHLARVVRRVGHCLATGESWEDTFPLRAGTGEYRWFLSRATPIRDAAGNISCWMGTNTDITEHRAAEEALRASETRLRKLADAMPQIVWMARPDGRLDYINERVTELSGVRRLGDGTWSWAGALVPEDRDATIEAWATAVGSGTPYEIAHRLKRTDGTVHWYLTRGVPVRDENHRIVRWFGTATDIENQKQAEEAVREADRHKTDFLAWLSHELRNPIGIIHISLALIRRAGLASEQGQRALPVIERQVAQVDRLLEDLLDIARISKGKILLRREPVELSEIVRTAGEDHRRMFEHEGIEFEVTLTNEPLRGCVDRARIAQAVGNLLHNAAKFTPRGGHVVLSLEAGANNTAIIEVRDNGAGLAPEMLTRVFEPLVQDIRTIHRSRGGVGLGLALVKQLAELHAGTANASSSAPGGGAVFTIRLPLEQGSPPDESRDDAGGASQTNSA